MLTLKSSVPSTQNGIYLAGTKGRRMRVMKGVPVFKLGSITAVLQHSPGEGLEVAQADMQLGRWLQGLGMPPLKGNKPKHAAACQHWHSPLHSVGMQESVQKCPHQYSSFWSGKGSRGLRTRTCINITVLAKPEFGRKTNVAFIKPLCVPSPEREAHQLGGELRAQSSHKS